jgi:pimeloyl-ACP methyl ester carboxylesterase
MEYADPDTRDGFGILLRRLIDQSRYATVRMDKPGVGESQGDCAKADFESEMGGWRAAFDAMPKYDFIDLDRVFVIGLSNGGGFSPLAARDHPVRGFISCGSWGRTWYEHMLELERRRLTAPERSPAEVNAAVKAFTEFYALDLMKGMSPAQVLALHPEWEKLWYDSPEPRRGLAERRRSRTCRPRRWRQHHEPGRQRSHCADRQPRPSGTRSLSPDRRHGT